MIMVISVDLLLYPLTPFFTVFRYSIMHEKSAFLEEWDGIFVWRVFKYTIELGFADGLRIYHSSF